jgi:hypothetical protein
VCHTQDYPGVGKKEQVTKQGYCRETQTTNHTLQPQAQQACNSSAAKPGNGAESLHAKP